MKTYLLAPVTNTDLARVELSRLLAGQIEPWLLLHSPRDPIAYFNVNEADDELSEQAHISADMSGRHYKEDEAVIEI